MRPPIVIALALAVSVGLVRAQESYPGQNELAAGVACYRNLDLSCARARLEKALAAFSPEKDENFIAHVSQARQMLALIFVAMDALEKAEREFKTLITLNPDYELPVGEHPPKVEYVFERARKSVAATVQKARRPPVAKPPVKKPPEKPEVRPTKTKTTSRKKPQPLYSLSAGARLVALFGDDADSVESGPGAVMEFGLRTSRWLVLLAGFSYSYHPLVSDSAALQSMSLSLGGQAGFELGLIELRTGIEMGALAMGTRDRYDHWGFLFSLRASVAWPFAKAWALSLSVNPSLVKTAGGMSFFLPVGLCGEFRW